SLAAPGSLPSEAAKANARLTVCSDVVMVRTTSTSAISGTGLKKCSPTKRSARFVAPAISAIVRLDVFEAKIVPAAHKPSSSWKSAFLSARSSVIASITMSTLRRSATTVVNALFQELDRKSTRLNSSHVAISYAVFCLKKKNQQRKQIYQLD